ncbi:MAG: hypothetical protein ACI9BW_001606 [Gammaproteobacteria bacterium]|jgi:hypothetical protein
MRLCENAYAHQPIPSLAPVIRPEEEVAFSLPRHREDCTVAATSLTATRTLVESCDLVALSGPRMCVIWMYSNKTPIMTEDILGIATNDRSSLDLQLGHFIEKGLTGTDAGDDAGLAAQVDSIAASMLELLCGDRRFLSELGRTCGRQFHGALISADARRDLGITTHKYLVGSQPDALWCKR